MSDSSIKKAFLLFSGHNERAVVALCRFFYQHHLPFIVIASGKNDSIFHTSWRANVVFCRVDNKVDGSLFEQVSDVAKNCGIKCLVLCPTTEFINQYALVERRLLRLLAIEVKMPSRALYLKLSNKKSNQSYASRHLGFLAPPRIKWTSLHPPCVLKPNSNIAKNEVLYPIICVTNKQIDEAVKVINKKEWFVQKYIEGQSYYLCGYLSKDGARSYYWQKNLMQQPGGKSIVFAKTVDSIHGCEEEIFNELHNLGYRGPFMMELLKDSKGVNYFIEINPRFWGPLQLAVDAHPEVLMEFVRDSGIPIGPIIKKNKDNKTHWYAWGWGADSPGCKKYPDFENITDSELQHFLKVNDVYGRPDTIKLHMKY